MSTTTTNLALVKPTTAELADITVVNTNMDTIDSAVAGKVSTSVTVNGHALTSNVSVTASDVGLGNCNNTSDANKPVSSAQSNAIGARIPFVEVINTVASAGTAQTIAEPAVQSINDFTLDNASPCVLTFPTATAGTSFTLILRQSGSTRPENR